MSNTEIEPYSVQIPQDELDDLYQRLGRTRWTSEFPDNDEEYGVSVDHVKELVEYWQQSYDWREHEAKLNEYPQFTTTIDGQNIHFLHVRSPESDALPLILTHGWPMSVMEYVDVVDALTDPGSHSGDPADAFHVVIPSIPGFGFSGPTTEPGWDTRRIATAWAELMNRLGYERYGAHGNDFGSEISPEIGRVDPDHAIGVHVTQIFSFPSGEPDDFELLSQDDMEKVEFLEWFWESMGAFNKLQSQAPATLAHALADSPAGQLAWSTQLFGDAVSEEYILTNVMIYWLTNTAGSSALVGYYEDEHASDNPDEPTTVPLGLANFADDFQSIRPFAERDHENIISWNTYDTGGHYPAQMTPDLLIDDIRQFFGQLR